MNVRQKRAQDDEWLRGVLERDWGGSTIVVHGDEIDLLAYPAVIAGERDGIAIFREEHAAELLLLSAFTKGVGIGSALLEAVIADLRERGAQSLRVTTTNDNLDALRFYQRRGFRLVELRPGGVNAARRRKPAIPEVGEYGIPLTDELDLVIRLDVS
jgi:ribosomal protein S18 acetylase RimI-like enzyme